MISLVRIIAKVGLFIVLFCLGARLIDPATFISLDATSAFAQWIYGNVNQENFDDLWVLSWVVFSFIFAMVFYKVTMLLINKYVSKP
ncbi:hypothetical protein EV102420_08_01800 [Pseudescherichia vulneris NBRC 102420]|uniref:Uncharacterized protein n=1 Tax=Pseudescherichia vulneris NBRC 102420 TaxID=1115515 RepID=A0A090VRG7_PSEVU|nr:hypothetical protein EV102420_08_01800 [Pseudescherichia vulneris NBRC 102420]STQ58265.1 Uncharacterised protein [Pseudescherichia vulneris]